MIHRSDRAFDADAPDREGIEAEAHAIPGAGAEEEARVRARFWPKLAGALSRIPFAEDAAAAYYCALDSQTPTRVRGLLFGALAYFLLPTDAVPDIIVGLGFTDDAAVLATALNLLASHIGADHRAAARAALERLRAS
ncbi:YkvA family protein [Ancylobacter sp. FA202]|uniref:YkvA family protein n=1 Tax=Ancylobacter sp. FA202 TaxID=1111106 RepID=UPI00036DD343|nr:YkvA family protein [Ancylobacter sp. FA202]